MHEQATADLHDCRVARRPFAELARGTPGEPVLDPAERMLGQPGRADLLGRRLGVDGARSRFKRGAIGFVDAVAARGRLRVGKGRIFARRRVAVVANQIHRFVVTEKDDDPAAVARRLALQLLERADDLQ